MSLCIALIGLARLSRGGSVPDAHMLWRLLAMGIAGGAGQMRGTASSHVAPLGGRSSFEDALLICAPPIGARLVDQPACRTTLLGAALIVTTALPVFLRNRPLARRSA